jgi:hypothetical protein
MQAFVGPLRFSVDTATNGPSFVSKCVASYMPGNVIGCRAIGEAISYSRDGNLAKRAGALCARMGNCTALLQGSISSCSLDLPGLPLGLLDLCTVEGVSTGFMITPAASGRVDFGNRQSVHLLPHQGSSSGTSLIINCEFMQLCRAEGVGHAEMLFAAKVGNMTVPLDHKSPLFDTAMM